MIDSLEIERVDALKILKDSGFVLHNFDDDWRQINIEFGLYISPDIIDSRPKVSFHWDDGGTYGSFKEYVDICKNILKG